MKLLFRGLVFVFLLVFFSCTNHKENEDVKILNAFLSDSTNIISDTILVKDKLLNIDNKKRNYSVRSFIDSKTLNFEISSDSIKNFLPQKQNFQHKYFIKKINFDKEFQVFYEKGNSFIVVSKPVISKNLNYALLEIGRINYYDISSYVLKVDSYATTFDLILYKKEKGKWKQLELIHRLYWKK